MLLPKLIWPDGSAMNDSTPLITRLEAEFTGRAVHPSSPATRFLADLLEDFADEWLTKAMCVPGSLALFRSLHPPLSAFFPLEPWFLDEVTAVGDDV